MISTGGILSLRLRRRALRRGFQRGRLREGWARPLDGPGASPQKVIRVRAGVDLDLTGFDSDVMAVTTPLMSRAEITMTSVAGIRRLARVI